MGIKEIKKERKELKDWIKELKKEGVDTYNLISVRHVRQLLRSMVDDKDDDKHNSGITFLKNNQTLVLESGFNEFEDNEDIVV
jgi:hypothetical protein